MKDIPGFEGRYAVTKDGKVWRYPWAFIRSNGFPMSRKKGRWLTPKKADSSGYYTVQIALKHIRIHRLVALTYIPNPENLPFVNHINFDRLDNRVENLEWCTPKGNSEHSARHGRMKPIQPRYGSKVHNSLLKETDIPQIREMRASGATYKTIGNEFGVHWCTIFDIFGPKKNWNHVK